MLTVDHARLRRKAGVVEVVPLCGLATPRALELAEIAIDIVKAHEGAARSDLEEALDALPVDTDAKEVRFGRGLKKLTLDACDFDVDSEVAPEELRAKVFAAAAAAHKAAAFDRAKLLGDVAAELGVPLDTIESALFADLPSAHSVTAFDVTSAGDLVERYRFGELQAVILRATRLVAELQASPAELRAVVRAAKLHQLLFDVEVVDGGVRLTLEGPMGMFQQSTRYGMKLAMVLPALVACRRHRIDATVRLRKGGATERAIIAGVGPGHATTGTPAASLGETARTLLADLDEARGKGASFGWQARAAVDVLTLPDAKNQGALVPDLVLEHDETGELVYVEVLGFWSREAVWRRVELVEQGLPFRIVFCASERLRVSEQALPDDGSNTTAALVTFKGALKASKVLDAVARVTRR